jgi:hypothetical protein
MVSPCILQDELAQAKAWQLQAGAEGDGTSGQLHRASAAAGSGSSELYRRAPESYMGLVAQASSGPGGRQLSLLFDDSEGSTLSSSVRSSVEASNDPSGALGRFGRTFISQLQSTQTALQSLASKVAADGSECAKHVALPAAFVIKAELEGCRQQLVMALCALDNVRADAAAAASAGSFAAAHPQKGALGSKEQDGSAAPLGPPPGGSLLDGDGWLIGSRQAAETAGSDGYDSDLSEGGQLDASALQMFEDACFQEEPRSTCAGGVVTSADASEGGPTHLQDQLLHAVS